jgi:hypothetical protein
VQEGQQEGGRAVAALALKVHNGVVVPHLIPSGRSWHGLELGYVTVCGS